MPPEPVDLLIEARWVLPMAPVNTVLTDHAVAVTSGRILALGPIAEMNARFEPRERVVRRDHALLPGFVNAHTLAPMTLFRGLRAQQAAPLSSPDFVREGTQLAIAEMLRAGITSFADMYPFPSEVARAAASARMRAAIGLPVADSPSPWAESATAYFERAEQLWDEYKSDPWVCLYFASHDSEGASDPTLIRLRRVADELDARVAMRAPSLKRMHGLGLLRPGFTTVGVKDALDDADTELIVTTGICVVANVQSDLRLGTSSILVSKLDSQHVTVAYGSGDPAAVGALDILAEARAAALFDNRLSAEDSLRIATLGGATALGLASVTGSIEPGKYADLVCFDLNRLACQPVTRVPDTILFSATREQASDVWTAGRAAVSNDRLLAFDEQELSAIANRWAPT